MRLPTAEIERLRPFVESLLSVDPDDSLDRWIIWGISEELICTCAPGMFGEALEMIGRALQLYAGPS